MFYVDHNSDNFTIIDCCITAETADAILADVSGRARKKGISRFVSTHPDEDHLRGLTLLDNKLQISNFYCIKNSATKDDESPDFKHYKKLRNSEKAFHLRQGCTRKWMNIEGDNRGSSGLFVHWPDTSNYEFKLALADAEDGLSPNNISPIIEYREPNANFIWMGDLETEFLEAIAEDLTLPKVDVLFAPHHGRDSGKVPQVLLDQLDPKIVVIGEAPSEHLNYYKGYDTITQNSAWDITFDCDGEHIHIYVLSKTYSVDFLCDLGLSNTLDRYLGSLKVG
jgi:hypothetical protein